jgi:hypothetical protein
VRRNLKGVLVLLGEFLGLRDKSFKGPFLALLTVFLEIPNILAVLDTLPLFCCRTFLTNSLAFSGDAFLISWYNLIIVYLLFLNSVSGWGFRGYGSPSRFITAKIK